ncbi:MAG: HD domain-containing protein [Alphaproteobacteria bacterium]|nr:HD domain-containing protein [Alphaproteobacteria bacterium]
MNDALLALLREAEALKDLPRAGWVRRGVPAPESVAAHSWGVAFLVLALLPDALDRGRALAYAVLHDLPEVRVGDLTPHDGVEAADKARREARAADALLAARPGLAALWHAYEAQTDPEARFVRQLDRLDMVLRAAALTDAGTGGLEEFVDSAARVVVDPDLRALLDALRPVVARRG